MKPYAVIEAPSNLGLKETGVDRLGETLLQLGLGRALRPVFSDRVPAPRYDPRRDPLNGMLNVEGLVSYTNALARAVGHAVDRGCFPVVLGGDCSIMLGDLLALRSRGRYGLLFADAHADFYQPEANVNGEMASSELAFATGRGPKVLSAWNGFERLVRDEDVAVVGTRDHEEQRAYGSKPLPLELLELSLADVRNFGAAEVAQRVLARVARDELDGFWIHLDADVLSDDIMPAVDYRIPGGLTSEELNAILRTALHSDRSVGMEITIYNPNLDPGLKAGSRLAAALIRCLGPEGK